MLSKVSFAIFLTMASLVGVVIWVAIASANDSPSLNYRVNLPIVFKQYSDSPPLPSAVVIDYFPLFDQGINAEQVTLRGHIVNSDFKKSKIYFYVQYIEDYTPSALDANCDPGFINSDFPKFNSSDGTFSYNFWVEGNRWRSLVDKIRVYLTNLSYCPPPLSPGGGGLGLPPDPPTSDVWAMIEIQKKWPDKWTITAQKP